MGIKKSATLPEKKDALKKLEARILTLQKESDMLREQIQNDENKLKAESFDQLNLTCSKLGVDFNRCGNLLLEAIKTQDYTGLQKYIEQSKLDKQEFEAQKEQTA